MDEQTRKFLMDVFKRTLEKDPIKEEEDINYKLRKAEGLYRLGFSLQEIQEKFHIDIINQAFLDYIERRKGYDDLVKKLFVLQYKLTSSEKKEIKERLTPEELVFAFIITKDILFLDGLKDISLNAINWIVTGNPKTFIPQTVLEWILFCLNV